MNSITFNAQVHVEMSWTELKALYEDKVLRLQRLELATSWQCWVSDGPTVYSTRLYLASKEPRGWSQEQKDENASDLAVMLAQPHGLLDTHATRQELVVGERGSRMDGCVTDWILAGWVRASFALTQDSHIAFAHAKSFQALPGDYGKTVVIHPAGRFLFPTGLSAGATTIDAGDPAKAGPYAYPGAHVELWSSADDTADLLEAIEVESVSGQIVTLVRATTVSLGADAQAVPILKSYTPLRGDKGLDGGARFVGSQTEKLGNPGEASAVVTAGAEVGIRFFASRARVAGEETALAITAMLRDVL